MDQPEKYTNAQFAAALEALTDEQLGQRARYWGENCGGVLRHDDDTPVRLVELYAGYKAVASDGRRAKAQASIGYTLPDETIVRNITGLVVLEEDYINPSGESCEPASHYLKGHPNCNCNEEDAMTQEDVDAECVYPAGTVIIELY